MDSKTLDQSLGDDFFDAESQRLSGGLFDARLNEDIGIWIYQFKPKRLFLNPNAKRLLQLQTQQSVFVSGAPGCLQALLQNPTKPGLRRCTGTNVHSYLIKQEPGHCAGIMLSSAEPPVDNEPACLPDITQLLLQLPHIAIQAYDQNGSVIHWNDESHKLYGYSPADALGKTMAELLIPHGQRNNFNATFKKWLKGEQVTEPRHCIRQNQNQEKLHIQTIQIPLQTKTQERQLYCLDYPSTPTRSQQQHIYELEYHDHLTKLPNRRLLKSLLQQSVKSHQQLELSTVVMFIGIDKFKLVNSQYGHAIGDKILQIIADRIVRNVKMQDLTARFGADVYVLTFGQPEGSQQASDIAKRLLAAMDKDLQLEQGPNKVSISIGLAISPLDGDDAATLLQHGDAALAQAQAFGGNHFVYFDSELNCSTNRDHYIAQDIKRALKDNELTLTFQPQYQLHSGQLCGSEALVRWHHKELGEISPAEFIPILEAQHKMLQLDLWVTKQVFSSIRSNINQGLHSPRTFANISASSINYPHFQTLLQNLIDQYGIPCYTIGIELTEYVFLNNAPQAVENLKWCKKKGIKIALDDFGTGFSSLSYLAKLPIDIIKIDKSFIGALEQKHHRELVKTIIAIAKALSLEIICEGVQTQEQEDFLQQHDCDMVQGHLYKPSLDRSQWQQLIAQARPYN